MRILVAGDFYPSERVKTLIEKKEYETILGFISDKWGKHFCITLFIYM